MLKIGKLRKITPSAPQAEKYLFLNRFGLYFLGVYWMKAKIEIYKFKKKIYIFFYTTHLSLSRNSYY